MAKFTLEDTRRLFTNIKDRPVNWKGQEFWVASCPICGGDDRAGFHEDEQGRVRWYCRHSENHPGCDRPGYWFADHLYFLLTGNRADTGFVPDSSKVGAPKGRVLPPAPKFNDMIVSPVKITLADVERFASNVDRAEHYYGSYGITKKTLYQFKVGYAEHPPHCSLPAGYSIPNLSYGPDGKIALRSLQIRRDDDVCRRILSGRSAAWLQEERDALFKRWTKQVEAGTRPESALHEVTDNDLLEYIYNKYSSISGSTPGIWGDDLVTLPGGEREGPNLPYIFINEDVKSGMVLRQDGWPATAYKRRTDWDAHLPTVFKNCAAVYIIGNNDTDWNNLDKGVIIARHIQECIQVGGKRSRIIYPPKKYSDVADLVKAEGFDAMRTWLASKIPGIEPVLEDKIYA